MIETKHQLKWEDAAKRVTPREGWACVKCGRWFGDDPDAERAARYCCATDAPCECGGRRSKHYTVCDACREKLRVAKWASLPEVEWDGETPLVVHQSDTWLFDVDDLADYLLEWELGDACPENCDDENHIRLACAKIQLCVCVPMEKRTFDLSEFVYDQYHDHDAELDDAGCAAEKAVNDWLATYRTMWSQGAERPSERSLLECLGLLGEAAEHA